MVAIVTPSTIRARCPAASVNSKSKETSGYWLELLGPKSEFGTIACSAVAGFPVVAVNRQTKNTHGNAPCERMIHAAYITPSTATISAGCERYLPSNGSRELGQHLSNNIHNTPQFTGGKKHVNNPTHEFFQITSVEGGM